MRTKRWWIAAAILLGLPACGGSSQAWSESAPSAASGGGGAAYAGDLFESDSESVETFQAESVPGSLVVSAAQTRTTPSGGNRSRTAPPAERQYAQADTSPTPEPVPPDQPNQPTPPPTADDAHRGPLLVYTANLGLAVYQVSEKQGMIEAFAREAGGHLDHRTGNEIRIRVPAESFERVLAQILELGEVLTRDVQVRDVTEQFHDLSLRIRTLEAMYTRVQQLLERAEDVEHALAVEQHLQRITMELEQARGQLRFLSNRVAFSTITVRFRERTTISEPTFALPFQWLRSLGLQNLMRLQ